MCRSEPIQPQQSQNQRKTEKERIHEPEAYPIPITLSQTPITTFKKEHEKSANLHGYNTPGEPTNVVTTWARSRNLNCVAIQQPRFHRLTGDRN